MKMFRIVVGTAVTVAIGAGAWTEARQAQAPAVSQDRAQDNRPPAGSPFSTLPGFSVVRVTPAEKTESYIVITFNAKGQPVVGQSASGNGSSPRLLIDANNDGMYEGEKIVSDRLNTCHGLFYEGNTLWANCFGRLDSDPAPPAPPAAPAGVPAPGGGQAGAQGRGGQGANSAGIPGLYKLQDTNNDDVMDTIERITRHTANGMGDHGPHAIRRGPDAAIMVVIGNNTYLGAPPVNDGMIDTTKSPSWNNLKERQFVPAFNDPRFGNSTRVGVHALLARMEANNKFSIQFSGMRNPYDFAYNLAGDAFVFDSDMEWDVNSPWYREVRTIHMAPGGDAGYRNGTGKYQDEYFDITPALRHLRRGSPVGVETYQAYAYPTRFFDNLFEADWSRGRLLYTALTPAGATYAGRQDLGEFVHGEPMPITDLEVAPDGNIYFTTGGSNTNGGLYKVVYTGPRPAQPDMTGILAVVRQPQPLSSWAWANIERIKGTMGAAAFSSELERVARNASAPSGDRSRALLEMQRHGTPPSAGLLRALLTDRDASVRATVVYVAGLQQSDARAIAAAGLKDADAMVQRKSAEALVRLGLTASQPSFAPVADIYNLLGSPDRFVRFAARVALEHTPRNQWEKLVLSETNVVRQTEGLLALINTKTSPADLESVGERTVALMRRTNLPVDQKTRVLRVYEVMVTEMPNGASSGIKKQVYEALINQFPTPAHLRPEDSFVGCAALWPGTTAAGCAMTMYAHHMAKVLASTGEPGVISKVFAVMPKGDADQPGQIDYMYALRQVDSGWSPAEKDQMIEFFARASKWRGGSTFAGHVNNVFDATIDALTDAEKQRMYAAAPLFAPLTEQELQAAAAGGGRGGGGGRAAGAGPAPGPGAPAAVAAGAAPVAAAAAPAGAAAATAPGGRGVAAPGGGRGAAALPASARPVPLDRQERYDNLVFPRGSGPGSLAGRGGAPNATAGAQTFQQVCAACHRVGTTGNTYGPDLSKIGQTTLRRDILRSIFFPEEKVDDRYQTTVITTRAGQTLRGLVVNETATSLMLVNADNTASPNTI
ncbi:MAG: c-type cytochrome, partial [Acidobacteria bacterium]|nr:c-type cytochrome [Acidobacteriota bacterium]